MFTRSVTLRLLPTREQEEILRQLMKCCRELWNELNKLRRRQWFRRRLDLSHPRDLYEKYKEFSPRIVAATIRLNDEAWNSFLALLEAKKEGKLPPFMKISPPKKYWKHAKFIPLRADGYEIVEGKKCKIVRIMVKRGLTLQLKAKGEIYWRGRFGRAFIKYDWARKKWYMRISITKITHKLENSEWIPVPRKPKGKLLAGVDVGIQNLMAVVVLDKGEVVATKIYSGGKLKALSFYWRRRIADLQSKLALNGLKTSRRLKRYYQRWRAQVRNTINENVRNCVEWLWSIGVNRVKVGYPKNIIQNSENNGKLNFEKIQVWSYKYLLKRLQYTCEEYGIKCLFVDEEGTSITCSRCGATGIRKHRGLFTCPNCGLEINADINAATNISRKRKKLKLV